MKLACDAKPLFAGATFRLLGSGARKLDRALPFRSHDLRDGQKHEQPRRHASVGPHPGDGSVPTRAGSHKNATYPTISDEMAAVRWPEMTAVAKATIKARKIGPLG